MTVVTHLLEFIRALRPELTHLFDKHRGDVNAARRDIQSLRNEIANDEKAIDEELSRRARVRKPRASVDSE